MWLCSVIKMYAVTVNIWFYLHLSSQVCYVFYLHVSVRYTVYTSWCAMNVRWRNLEISFWRQQSHRWFSLTCMMIGWKRSRRTRRSVVSFWYCVQCMSTMTGPRWCSSPTRRPSLNLTTSGRHWLMRSGSRLRSSWRIWSLLTTARRTSENFCDFVYFTTVVCGRYLQ